MSTTEAPSKPSVIAPHGGTLVNRVLTGPARDAKLAAAAKLPKVALSSTQLQDAENIALGLFSPLTGFMTKAEVDAVVHKMRLPSGAAWSIPIVLDVTPTVADAVAGGSDVALTDDKGTIYAVMHVAEKFTYDPKTFVTNVFGTDDEKHPGVKMTYEHKGAYLGGDIEMLQLTEKAFPSHYKTPAEMRALVAERGWKTMVAFQTRNAPHGGHEYMQKMGLSMFDGLLIQPVIGPKKPGDFKDDVIIKAYEAIIKERYPKARTILAILPFAMRYAGPREAIFHAIVRKNFGCTHIVIGRDHAGVGKYYHPEAAIEIFQQFPDLGIQPFTVHGNFFYSSRLGELVSERTSDEDPNEGQSFSGTIVRKMLVDGQTPRPEVFRPEVFAVLKEFGDPFVS